MTSRKVGRYVLFKPIGSGGMGTVHLARLAGEGGFSRLVAIKAMSGADESSDAVRMFLDEARIAAQVRHPNVVSTIDVLSQDGEILLVMDYVHGLSLAQLTRLVGGAVAPLDLSIISAVMAGVLHGLHAAHEAADAQGYPLGLVHRDVSPQNVLVGADGVARLADFGVAKAAGRLQTTIDGGVKGKLAYMAPEQFRDEDIDRRADIFSAGVVLWELLARRRLFDAKNEGAVVARLLEGVTDPPSTFEPSVPPALDALVMKCLALSPAERPETARDVARELERIAPPASPADVADWVERVGRPLLDTQLAIANEIERTQIAPITAKDRRVIVLGLYRYEGKRTLGPVIKSFCEWLGEQIDAEVVHRPAPDYVALTEDIKRGRSDFSWLPPIAVLYIGEEAVEPLFVASRGGRSDFECVVVAPEGSPIATLDDLRGKRAAWVNPWSAAGYILPRVKLHEHGFPREGAFASESFHGSHSDAVRAVIEGEVDFAATYSNGKTAEGEIVEGAVWPWQTRYARMRIVASLGRVPSDALVVSRALPADVVERLTTAIRESTNGLPMAPIVKSMFGADAFAPFEKDTYDPLRTIIAGAEELGLLRPIVIEASSTKSSI